MSVPRSSRLRALSAIAVVLLAGVLLAHGPLPAGATTGNAEGLPVPKAKVPTSIGDLYLGRFFIRSIGRGAKIQSGVIDVDYTEFSVHQFLVGNGEFYQYDSQGNLTSFTTSLYPWEARGEHIYCNLLVAGTSDHVVGRLALGRPPVADTDAHPYQETISGTITLNGATYPLTLRQAEDNAPPMTVLPRAVQIGPATPGEAALETARNAGVYASAARYAVSLGTGE